MWSVAWRTSPLTQRFATYADRRLTRRSRKRVLIAATGALTLRYGLLAWETVADVPGVDGYFSTMSDFEIPSEMSVEADRLGLREVDRQLASFRWWDAVILADHVSSKAFAAGIPRVSIRHGLAPTKSFRGQGYQFDPHFILRPDGSPVYTLHLAVSHEEAEGLLALHPVYKDRVVVAGDLRADRLLDMASQDRGELRQGLGIRSDLVAVIMSTWDEFSLIETIGHDLVAALPPFVDGNRDVAVVLMMHPHLWQGNLLTYTETGPRVETTRADWAKLVSAIRSERIIVVGPNEDWERYLAIADMALVDHTSLASTFGLLKRPMIPIRVPLEILHEESFSRLLQERMRPVDTAADALDEIRHGSHSRSMDEVLRTKADSLLDNRGDARSATRDALLELLGLSESYPEVR